MQILPNHNKTYKDNIKLGVIMKHILIKLPNWLGDAMMLTPTIDFLVRIFPNVKIILVGNNLSSSVFSIQDSIIKIFIDNTKKAKGIINRIRSTMKLANDINSYLYIQNITLDCAITTQNNFFSAFLIAKITAKKHIGYGDKNIFGMRKFFLTDVVKYKSGRPPECTHQVLSYIHLLLPILPYSFFKDYPLDTKASHYNQSASRIQNILYQEAKELKLYLPITTQKGHQNIIAISTGASYGDSKMWLISHFIEIIIDFVKKGYMIRIYGTQSEIDRNNQIEQEANKALPKNYQDKIENLSGKTNIQELTNSLNECKLYIGNDSGTTHIARALKIPSIIIFGPMPFAWCSPWSKSQTIKKDSHYITDNAISIQKDLDCVPCKQKTCPLKHHNCMKLITPDEVLKLSYTLLKNE